MSYIQLPDSEYQRIVKSFKFDTPIPIRDCLTYSRNLTSNHRDLLSINGRHVEYSYINCVPVYVGDIIEKIDSDIVAQNLFDRLLDSLVEPKDEYRYRVGQDTVKLYESSNYEVLGEFNSMNYLFNTRSQTSSLTDTLDSVIVI